MIARLKIGSPIFQNANVAAGIFDTELDYCVGIANAIASFRCNEHGGTRVRGKPEKGLDEPPVVERIGSQPTKVIEAVNEDTPDMGVINGFRDFFRNRFTLDFGWRK